MNQEKQIDEDDEKMAIIRAQNAIAVLIPEIEQLAWKFFVIVRELDAPLNDESFLDEKPGPRHLRWRVALGAMSTYSELVDLIPYARENAKYTDAQLLKEWARMQAQPTEERGKMRRELDNLTVVVNRMQELVAKAIAEKETPQGGEA